MPGPNLHEVIMGKRICWSVTKDKTAVIALDQAGIHQFSVCMNDQTQDSGRFYEIEINCQIVLQRQYSELYNYYDYICALPPFGTFNWES